MNSQSQERANGVAFTCNQRLVYIWEGKCGENSHFSGYNLYIIDELVFVDLFISSFPWFTPLLLCWLSKHGSPCGTIVLFSSSLRAPAENCVHRVKMSQTPHSFGNVNFSSAISDFFIFLFRSMGSMVAVFPMGASM